jgi:hypothetical protein
MLCQSKRLLQTGKTYSPRFHVVKFFFLPQLAMSPGWADSLAKNGLILDTFAALPARNSMLQNRESKCPLPGFHQVIVCWYLAQHSVWDLLLLQFYSSRSLPPVFPIEFSTQISESSP